MSTIDSEIGQAKPALLRAIFILNGLKIILAFGFFAAFQFFGLEIGGQKIGGDTTLIMYTALGYVATFAAIVFSILKRNLLGVRIAIALDFLVSIPATAVIGFVIAIISMGLTFTAPVLAYFAYSRRPA